VGEIVKKKMRRFTPDEKTTYKDTFNHHLEMQKMTPEQAKAWKRKPYCLGGAKCFYQS